MTAKSLLDLANKQPKAIDSVLEDHFAQMSLRGRSYDC